MRRDVNSRRIQAGMFVITAMSLGSCSDQIRSGRSPAFLIVESVQAASGSTPGQFSGFLLSDVEVLVEQRINGQSVRVPTIVNDSGRATFRLQLRDPGTPANPTAPSALNEITLNRCRVNFRRADGRNTPGVDVPYGFDAALTITVPANGSVTAAFELVRHQMKKEPPLRNLARSGGQNLISTIAEITFYGRDQAGNHVEATGSISVNFGDFADPS
jgi:hypothetical protein